MSDLRTAQCILSTFKESAQKSGEFGFDAFGQFHIYRRGTFLSAHKKRVRNHWGSEPTVVLGNENMRLKKLLQGRLKDVYGEKAVKVADEILGNRSLSCRRVRKVFNRIGQDKEMFRAKFFVDKQSYQGTAIFQTFDALIDDLRRNGDIPKNSQEKMDEFKLKELAENLVQESKENFSFAQRLKRVRDGIIDIFQTKYLVTKPSEENTKISQSLKGLIDDLQKNGDIPSGLLEKIDLSDLRELAEKLIEQSNEKHLSFRQNYQVVRNGFIEYFQQWEYARSIVYRNCFNSNAREKLDILFYDRLTDRSVILSLPGKDRPQLMWKIIENRQGDIEEVLPEKPRIISNIQPSGTVPESIIKKQSRYQNTKTSPLTPLPISQTGENNDINIEKQIKEQNNNNNDNELEIKHDSDIKDLSNITDLQQPLIPSNPKIEENNSNDDELEIKEDTAQQNIRHIKNNFPSTSSIIDSIVENFNYSKVDKAILTNWENNFKTKPKKNKFNITKFFQQWEKIRSSVYDSFVFKLKVEKEVIDIFLYDFLLHKSVVTLPPKNRFRVMELMTLKYVYSITTFTNDKSNLQFLTVSNNSAIKRIMNNSIFHAPAMPEKFTVISKNKIKIFFPHTLYTQLKNFNRKFEPSFSSFSILWKV